MAENATITLVRHSAYPNRIRAYRVFADNREIGTVKNGSTTTVAVPSGKHQMFVKLDWVRSTPLELVIEPGEHIHVDCVTSLDPVQMALAGFGRPSTHISLHRRDEQGRLSDKSAQLPRVDKSKLLKALLWFAGCIAAGFLVSILVSNMVQSDAAGDRLSYLIGQVSVIVATVGAGWIFVRR